MEMKRILLHVIFWVVYTLQDAIVGMIWAGPESAIGSGPMWKALMDALLCLVAKFLFTYYVLEVSVPRIVAGKYKLTRIVGEMVFVFMLSIFVYRVIAFYLIFPQVYHVHSPTGLVSLRGIFGAM